MSDFWPIKNMSIAVIPVLEENLTSAKQSFTEMIYNKSMLEIRIEQLKTAKQYNKIYLSSGSRSVKEIADKHNVDFIFRNSDLYTPNARWSDVLYAVVNSAQGFNPMMAWLKRTKIQGKDRKSTMQINSNHFMFDHLISVSTIQDYSRGNKNKMTKYLWGISNSYSNDLEKLYRQTGALLIARKRDMFNVRSEVTIKPHMQILNRNMNNGVVVNEALEFSIRKNGNQHLQRAV